MDFRPVNRPAPQEPRVHGNGWALFFLVVGAYYFLSGISIMLFPRNVDQLSTWWIAVLVGLALFGVSFLLFRRRRRDLSAHERWAADFAAWQQEQDALSRDAHAREMERLEKELQIEQAKLDRLKTQIAVEFGQGSSGASSVEEYAVAGTSRRQDVIKSLGYENEEYRYSRRQIEEEGLEDEHIEKLLFPDLTATLVPEPGNSHDPNAVKVLLSGEFVGYIPAESSAHVRQLMDQSKISQISVRIVGGPYKVYDSVDEEFYKKDLFYGVRLQLYIRN